MYKYELLLERAWWVPLFLRFVDAVCLVFPVKPDKRRVEWIIYEYGTRKTLKFIRNH